MTAYSIWALESSYIQEYPDSALIWGTTEGARRLPFPYFVIKGEGRVILVDTGFSDTEWGLEQFEHYGIKEFKRPDVILARVGLTPEDVDTVIITHHHFDHISGLRYFPNATVYLQQREAENYLTKITAPPRLKWLCAALDPNTGPDLLAIGAEGRLRLVEGVADVAPGLQVRPAHDTHTAGSQYAVLESNDASDPWIFCGDVVYVYENVGGLEGTEPHVPVGYGQGNWECCVRSSDEMVTVAGDNVRRLIPSHDVRLWDLFPTKTYEDGLHVTEIQLADGEPSKV